MGRSALEDRVKSVKKKAKDTYKKIRDSVRGGDPNDVADQMGGQLGNTVDAIRERRKKLDEI